MQHLRARLGQFRGFAVGDLAEDFRIGHQTRIGRHNAIHIGPDPEFGRVERGCENAGAEKSEPPRPSVVGRPSAVAPLKPVTTGIPPARRIGSKRACAFSRSRPSAARRY